MAQKGGEFGAGEATLADKDRRNCCTALSSSRGSRYLFGLACDNRGVPGSVSRI
jgi:hypothetical protein